MTIIDHLGSAMRVGSRIVARLRGRLDIVANFGAAALLLTGAIVLALPSTAIACGNGCVLLCCTRWGIYYICYACGCCI